MGRHVRGASALACAGGTRTSGPFFCSFSDSRCVSDEQRPLSSPEEAEEEWGVTASGFPGSPPIQLPERLGGGGLGPALLLMESWITDQGTLSFDGLVSGTSSFERYLFACRWCCGCYTSLTAQPKKLRNLSPRALVTGSTSRPTKT